jgi:hypothetical protein
MKGVTPLLRTVNPKSKDDPKANDAIISWAYDRPEGGRSFVFTGGHLHRASPRTATAGSSPRNSLGRRGLTCRRRARR